MKKRLGETAGNDGGFGICLANLFYLGGKHGKQVTKEGNELVHGYYACVW